MNGEESELANQVPDPGMIANATGMRARDPWEMEQRRRAQIPSGYKSVQGNLCYIHTAEHQEGFVVTDSPNRGAGRLLALDGLWSHVGDVLDTFAGALNLIDKYCDKRPPPPEPPKPDKPKYFA